MAQQQRQDLKVLERGNIYFLYRPRVEEKSVEGPEDVERLYLVLKPEGEQRLSLIVIGRKRLPGSGQQHGGQGGDGGGDW